MRIIHVTTPRSNMCHLHSQTVWWTWTVASAVVVASWAMGAAQISVTGSTSATASAEPLLPALLQQLRLLRGCCRYCNIRGHACGR